MKLNKLSTLCLAASTLFAASSVMAWESEDGAHSTSASVALTTDYVWRGVTQTLRDPAIQGSVDYTHSSGFYAGVWASNVDFTDDAPDDGADIEVDAYFGIGGELDNGIGWDIGYLRYIYPGTTAGNDFDWNEYHISASYSYFSASINYSNDYLALDDTGLYYTLGAEYGINNFTVSANINYLDADDLGENLGNDPSDEGGFDYNIGVSTGLAGFDFDLRYYDTGSELEDSFGSDDPSDRVVFTISKSL